MKQPTPSSACRIAPGLEADPVALRLAALSAKLAPSAKVLITTSDAIGELPEGALLSAQNKLAKLGVDSPTVFQWVSRHEQKVDWNKVKTEADLRQVVSTRFAERAKVEPYLLKLDHQSDAAVKQVEAMQRMAQHDPDAANTLRQYQANPAQHWGNLVGYVNSQRVKNVSEWQTYLTQDNEEYSRDPYWQDLAWDIVDGALTSDRNHGLGTTIHLNQGILAELRQSINGKTQLVSLASNYGKLQVEFAKASSAEVVTTASAREWVYIPSKAEDPVNFEANVQKLKDLSCSTWCTKTFNAEPYLSRGGAWLLTEGSRTIAQIRLEGSKIAEIQGVKNDNIIPPEAGPDIDDLLAAHPELNGVNLWRAKNPGATSSTLAQLALDKDAQVREAVAANPNTPSEALDRLAYDLNGNVLIEVARNPSTSPETLIRLIETLDGDRGRWVRRNALENPNLPREVFEQLAVHPIFDIRWAVANCERTPASVFEQLAEEKDYSFLHTLVSNRNISAAALAKLATSEFVAIRQQVARHERTPLAMLRGLAKDEKEEVRKHLFDNPSITGELLHLLAADKNRFIRGKVAVHEKTPPAILAVLAKDKVLGVRELVAQNSRTPEATLALLSADLRLSHYVAGNPNTSPSTLAALAATGHWGIMERVAKHPRTSAETLTELAKQATKLARNDVGFDVGLALNPNTPAEALSLLCKPENYRFEFSQTAFF